MAKFSIPCARTASTTLAVGSVTAAAASPRRGKLYDLIIGSEATPADNAFLWSLQRCTTAGTATAVTPLPLDPADSTAATIVGGQNHTVDPTGSTEIMRMPLNQRATFRWVAAPGSELLIPATASNGLKLETPTSSAVLVSATFLVEEQ